MEPARNLVGVVLARVFELSARVKLGHDDLGGGDAFAGVDAGGDAAAVILDRHRTVGVELDQDEIAVPGECFVDGIIRHFEHHVVQARTIVGVANIHAGALAHGVKALEHLDRIRAIGTIGGCPATFTVACHADYIGIAGALPKRNRIAGGAFPHKSRRDT